MACPRPFREWTHILGEVYDEAFYHLSIDYTQDPPPLPLSAEDAAWLKEVTLSSGRKVN